MAKVFSAVLRHHGPTCGRKSHSSIVPGSPEEAMERVLRYRRASAHVVGNRVIDWMGAPRLFTEHHWFFAEDDAPDDVFDPPWTPAGEPTPWLTDTNHLIGPPLPPPELVGNQFSLF